MSIGGGLYLAFPWALLLWPLALWLCLRAPRQGNAPSALSFSSLKLLGELAKNPGAPKRAKTAWLRLGALTLLLTALTCPRQRVSVAPSSSEGIDILLLVDASRSMDAKDFEQGDKTVSRLDALRQIVAEFVKARPQDRLGVLAFAEKPYLVSPLTLDHSWIDETLRQLQTSLGTAIGGAIEAGTDLLEAGSGRSRVMILLTDGLNTSGADPLVAATVAAEHRVRIYTIELVTYDKMHTEDLGAHPLAVIARTTGGQFYQAPDAATLESVYRGINELEKNRLQQMRQLEDRPLFAWLLVPAVLLLLLEWALRQRRGPSLP